MNKHIKKLVKLPRKTKKNPLPIFTWLRSLSIDTFPIIPTTVFKKYLPLDRGNQKLFPNILSFSLLSFVTCPFECLGCYDVKAMRYTSCRAKRMLNTSMAIHNLELLERLIIKQILNSRSVEFVRIHVGGEFFNKSYIKMWIRIANKIHESKPAICFYTYTKKPEYTRILKGANINVVQSQYGKDFNFAPYKDIKELAKKHKGIICPATLPHNKGKKIQCGKDCSACMQMKNVFFVKHG